ncbi:hypothetical protein F5Y01DRAFT_269753 [Xylaria sp. FL0043]|nr:hypothetical protein F5Y01DRAFT_269753 [Xylaria sp. FL0043]
MIGGSSRFTCALSCSSSLGLIIPVLLPYLCSSRGDHTVHGSEGSGPVPGSAHDRAFTLSHRMHGIMPGRITRCPMHLLPTCWM